jgi:hypothetical protein
MTLHELEQTIAKLPPAELSEFREWFLRFDGDWDEQIEKDATRQARVPRTSRSTRVPKRPDESSMIHHATSGFFDLARVIDRDRLDPGLGS